MDDAADFRTDTAERPAISGVPLAEPEAERGAEPVDTRLRAAEDVVAQLWTTPVQTEPEPSAARFPLYADEVTPVSRVVVPPAWEEDDEPRRAWAPLIAIVVAVLLVVALGSWLLLGGEGDGNDQQPVAGETTASGSPVTSPTPSASPKPSPKVPVTAPADPTNIARFARARPEHTARPNQDLTGDMVRYGGANMLDGVPETTWRMPGDGTGDVITITLAEPSVITELGLINGYAKIDRDGKGGRTNWYTRNRRITKVEWIFDDGSSVIQDLEMTRVPQVRSVDPVLTSTIRLRLVEVTPPYSRDYTAISDVVIVGGRA